MNNVMQSGNGWKWYGFPGHFTGGKDCAFHLCTVVNGYLVSTVGAYFPGSSESMETIGLDRYYETFVFECPGDDENGNPIMGDGEIDTRAYNDSVSAEQGHYKVCWEYAKRESGND